MRTSKKITTPIEVKRDRYVNGVLTFARSSGQSLKLVVTENRACEMKIALCRLNCLAVIEVSSSVGLIKVGKLCGRAAKKIMMNDFLKNLKAGCR